MSGSRQIKQGLPQGSVLSPILFLFYINTLARLLPTDNVNSLYADDVSILATNDSLVKANTDAQAAVNVVTEWSKEWKLSLNAGKCEVSFFSNSTKDAKDARLGKWVPEISINGKPAKFKTTLRLLGVRLDRSLCFGPHIDDIEEKNKSKISMISAVAHSDWG
jgi:hypothetical protein